MKHSLVLPNPTAVSNISGKFIIDRYVEFNPFPDLTEKNFKFHVFEFHKFFHGLIGYETLQELKAKIDTSDNTITVLDTKIQMFKKYPQPFSKEVSGESIYNMEIPVSEKSGDFLLEENLEITSNIFIHAGLYKAQDHKATVKIQNNSTENQTLVLDYPFEVTLNNFEHILMEHDLNNTECTSKPDRYKKLVDQLRLGHLNDEEKAKLITVIKENQDIFHLDNEPLTTTNVVKHKISTHDEIPVYQKSYRYPHCHKEEVCRQIQKMLKENIIQPSTSPWNSPIWVVPKKIDAAGTQKWRIVVDYRKLNAKTIDDKFPIPNITDILDKLGRSRYFTTLDLASGFHQILMDERDIQKTAFSTENGHYEYLRMPFGLKNAPATFQRTMNAVLIGLAGVICLVYMDDIIVFSYSLQEHCINLSKVFEALKKANLKIQLDKSEFLKKEVSFLGHIVNEEGVKPNPEKIEAIQNWPIPNNEKEIKAFLGTLGYYRKFIKDFSRITKPLTQCLRKDEKVVHTHEFLKAFNKCKQILTSSAILVHPDFESPFILTTDASKYAIGAVLSQGPIGRDKPIAFASRTLNKSEENYSTIEKELLAIYWATKYFRPYLFGNKFLLFTDHKPLTCAVNLKDPSGKIGRWMIALLDYSYDIRYRAGKQNVVADGLSRIPHEINANIQEDDSSSDDVTQHSADTDDSEFIPCTEKPVNMFSNQIILNIGPDENENTGEQVFPKVLRHTFTKINFGVPTILRIFKEFMDPRRVNCIHCPENLINSIQMVYKNYFSRIKTFKIVISQKFLIDLRTEAEQNAVIEEVHTRAHRGIEENLMVINQKYFFPKSKHKIRRYVLLCKNCNKAKYERHPYKLSLAQTPIPEKPLDIVHMDIFICNQNIFLSALDKLSKFGILIPIKSRSIPDIRSGLTKFFSTYGMPKLIVSDNEPAIRSIEVRGMLEDLGVEIYFTPSNKSEVNGIVERFHSTLSEIFRCNKEKYNELNQKELFRISVALYNDTVHSCTKMRPKEVFFGIKEGEVRLNNIAEIIEKRNKIYEEATLALRKKQKKDLNFHNKNKETDPSLNTDEPVYIAQQGVKNKTKDKYRRYQVMRDHSKTFEDQTGRKIHKTKIRRQRK